MDNVNMPHGPRQKQMGVVLSDDIRAGLEAAAAKNGCSLGEEIRDRLWRTFKEDAIPDSLRNFMTEVGVLAFLTDTQTGQNCQTHPAASAVFRHAISARLARTKAEGPETFAPGELLPSRRWVAPGSDDPQTLGIALEARLQGLVEQLGENPEDRKILWDVVWRRWERSERDGT